MSESRQSKSGARPLEPHERIVRILPDGTEEEVPREMQERLATGIDWQPKDESQ